MIKLSRKQALELDAIKEFIPDWCDFEPVTDSDIAAFFAWSDRGIPYRLSDNLSGLAALHFGKQYRDLHVTLYRQDIKGGLMPRQVLDVSPFMHKALA